MKRMSWILAALLIGESSLAQSLSYTLITSGLDTVTFETGCPSWKQAI